MVYLGEHIKRKTYWLNFSQEDYTGLPDSNWVCFVTADNNISPEVFESFVREVARKGVLEIKFHGTYSEQLHDWFDEIIVEMEVVEGHAEYDIMTTWHKDEGLASAFWQCFYVTVLSDSADLDSIKIVCTDVNNINKKDKLTEYLRRFNEEKWIPEEEE